MDNIKIKDLFSCEERIDVREVRDPQIDSLKETIDTYNHYLENYNMAMRRYQQFMSDEACMEGIPVTPDNEAGEEKSEVPQS